MFIKAQKQKNLGISLVLWLYCGDGLNVIPRGSCLGRLVLGVMMWRGGGTFKGWTYCKIIRSLEAVFSQGIRAALSCSPR